LYQAALRLALRAGRPVVVDSRHRMGVFPGATLLTPNVAETEEAVGRKIVTEEDLIGAGWSLMARLKPRGLLITRGPDGMSLFLPDGSLTHIPAANRQEVFDVSGAGDTVVAAAALGLAAGLEMLPSARLANFAAGVVVRKMGTAAVTPEELRRAIGKSAENGAGWPIAPAIGLGAQN
ncbi:MAG: bifunctional heptose 7-phosphate kinase/heptose 1-phosphate adenyltransferase, partial [Bacteroidota bacterium]